MSEICECGHLLDEHAGNGEWCEAVECRCVYFEAEEDDDE